MKKEIVCLLLCLLIGCSVSRQVTLPLLFVPRSDEERKEAYDKVIDYGLSRVDMTNRWRDSLIYNKDTILINYSPLLEFKGITRAILHANETKIVPYKSGEKGYWISGSPVFHCDREYTACWYILDGKLYLGKVSPREFTEYFFYAPQKIKQSVINRRIEQATERKYKNGLLFADWVNGTIEGNIGGVKDITQDHLVIINSPQKVTLRFKQGVLEKIEVKDIHY